MSLPGRCPPLLLAQLLAQLLAHDLLCLLGQFLEQRGISFLPLAGTRARRPSGAKRGHIGWLHDGVACQRICHGSLTARCGAEPPTAQGPSDRSTSCQSAMATRTKTPCATRSPRATVTGSERILSN